MKSFFYKNISETKKYFSRKYNFLETLKTSFIIIKLN